MKTLTQLREESLSLDQAERHRRHLATARPLGGVNVKARYKKKQRMAEENGDEIQGSARNQKLKYKRRGADEIVFNPPKIELINY